MPIDGAICHSLRRSAFLDAFSESLTPDETQAGAESYGVVEFAERISAMETLVATVDGSVMGFCTIRVDSPIRAEVLYLYIDSQHRTAGVGSRLVHQAEQKVLSSHPEIIMLYLDTAVPDYNQRFWERMGYRYVGPSTCRYPSGRIPAVRLEKAVLGCGE
jgi:GNAT superfamily N-acetyltransferase